MQADTKRETVHMKLEWKMTEPLTKLDPKIYQKYMTNKKDRTVLYVELKIPIWPAPGSAPVLAKFDVKPTGVGV